jgi:tetratricopeptide (TPR) repeat protein
LLVKGDLDAAIAELRETIRLQGGKGGFAAYVLGDALYAKGEAGAAVPYYRECLRDSPNWVEPRLGLANALRDLGRFDEGLAEYRELTRRHPKNVPSLSGAAWLLATIPEPRSRNPEEALGYARRAREVRPDDPGLVNTLGVAEYYAEHYKEALATLQKSADLRNGGDEYDWFFLAMASLRLGDRESRR